MITDAQVHIWAHESPERPWPGGANRAAPHLPDGLSAERFISEMDAAGVDRAVIVPPSWVGENNDEAIEAAAKYPRRFAVMGRFDPKRPDAFQALAAWRQQPYMLGIRLTLFRGFEAWLEDGTLSDFWPACERLGIPVMALTPGAAGRLEPVAARHPGLTLIMDHMAADLSARGGQAFAALDQLLALAAYPRVFVKVSSAPCFSDEPYPFADIYPYLRQIYDAFGPQRLMWGADFSRLTSTYSECLEHFRSGLDFLSEDDKEWILGRTLAESLEWPEDEGGWATAG
jgi:predicted TIM-barrel fold metal-dependent hydrolase